MKVFFGSLVAILLFHSSAFAGSRTIVCKGAQVQLEVFAKGPIPAEPVSLIEIYGVETPLNQVFQSNQNKKGYFLYIYQSDNTHGGYTVMLSYDDGKHQLHVFKDGKVIDEMNCILGF